jgi:hypothetical protein
MNDGLKERITSNNLKKLEVCKNILIHSRSLLILIVDSSTDATRVEILPSWSGPYHVA